jgi:phenylalanyl-tRNA synthetase beta chain
MDEVLRIRVPGFRSYDVTREVDLIEEVARTHGFDKFPEALGPQRASSVSDHPLFQLEDRLRAALVGHGLFETQTPAFCRAGEGDVEVLNPLTTVEPFLRSSLMPALLRRVEYNLARGNRDVRLFELGTSFRKRGSGEPPLEVPHVAVILTGRREPPHWSLADEQFSMWDLKALFADIVDRVYGDDEVTIELVGEASPDLLDDRCCVSVCTSSGDVVGYGGRIAAEVCDVPVWAGDVWSFELGLPPHPSKATEVVATPLPQFPASERDLALLLPGTVTSAETSESIRRSAGPDLESLEIFDLYIGDGIPAGVRSVAFRLRFRSATKTLKDKQVDKNMRTVLKRLEEDLGVRVRD